MWMEVSTLQASNIKGKTFQFARAWRAGLLCSEWVTNSVNFIFLWFQSFSTELGTKHRIFPLLSAEGSWVFVLLHGISALFLSNFASVIWWHCRCCSSVVAHRRELHFYEDSTFISKYSSIIFFLQFYLWRSKKTSTKTVTKLPRVGMFLQE